MNKQWKNNKFGHFLVVVTADISVRGCVILMTWNSGNLLDIKVSRVAIQ